MDFLPPDIEEYSERFTSNEPPLLTELNRYTHNNVLQPRMLAGHLQGRVIAMMSKMIQPKSVLEIGTYTGYSALCWAEGLVDGGVVHTIEVDDELAIKTCVIHNYKYAVITPNDIVIPPKNDKFQED